jgi:YidC/Oxa1 family membrane protein insertase
MAYQFFYAGPRTRRAQELERAQQERLEASQPQVTEGVAEEPTGTAPLATDDRIAADDPPALEDETAAENLPPANAEAAQHITVITPLYEITFSTLGAELVAVRLLGYETEGQPVQLVRGDPAMDGGLIRVSLAGDERSLALRGVLFEAFSDRSVEPLLSGETITLDESTPERKLSFRTADTSGRSVVREYTFAADTYMVRSRIQFAASAYPFAREIVWSFGPGLRATEKNEQGDYDAMRASLRLGDEYYRKKRGDFEEDFSGMVQWASLQMKYFAAIMIPEAPTGGGAQMVSVKNENYMTAAIKLPAAERRGSVSQIVDVYLGPLDYQQLKTIGRGLEKNVDIGFDHFKIFKPVSVAILWSMVWLHKIIPNYGIVIILISVLTKILFYRLTHKSFKSMRDMQLLQPKLQALKEKHKDDRQKLSQETMKVYKEAGVNPLGGCLPMVFQMPVFIALFSVLRNTIEIRQAPFFSWINDLSQQDVLFGLPFSLPMIGSAVSVLPILMGASMFMQSKIGGSIAGPSSTTTQPKAFVYMLPVVFTLLFYRMPSGLVLYWLVNTVMSVAQQYYINKGSDKDEKNNVGNEKPAKVEKPVKAERPVKTDKPVRKSNARKPRTNKPRRQKG